MSSHAGATPSPLPLAGGVGGGPVPQAVSVRRWRGGCPPLSSPACGRGIALAALLLPSPLAAAPSSGAIFDAAIGYAPLYEGLRSKRVGDTVTVLLAESTTTEKTVTTKSQKGGKASITPPTAGLLSFLNPNALKAASDSSFNGGGKRRQTSKFSATLSVTIAEVRANGTALVRGEKKMLLSQGDEWIRFSGVIRLADIDQDNTLPSSRVADAHIEYSGKGALQRASKQGWLSRLFNLVSPF